MDNQTVTTLDNYLEFDHSIFTKCLGCRELFLKSDNHTCGNVPEIVRRAHQILTDLAQPIPLRNLEDMTDRHIIYWLQKYRDIFSYDGTFISLKEWN